MIEKHIKRLIEVVFLISIITACIASVFIGRHYDASISSIQQNTLRELSHGWQYQTDTGKEEIECLPATVELSSASEEITLYYRLPEDLPRNSCLEFVSRQTEVEVFLDGQSIYAYSIDKANSFGKLLGNFRNEIPLPADAGGKEISIRLVSSSPVDIYRISTITLGSRAQLLHQFFRDNIGLVMFCGFSVILCMLILFIVIFFKIKKVPINAPAFISFVIFVFLSATWIITDSNILQLLVSNISLVYFISHITFMLFPIPFMLFMIQTTSYGSRWYSALCIMYLLGFFLRIGLFFGKIASLEKSLYITHIMMGIGIIVGCILLVREWRMQHNKSAFMPLVGFVALGICLSISLIVFFMYPERNYSVFFLIMLILMMLVMLYKFFSPLQSMAKEGIKAQLYHEMAYIDILTKLPNRLAFEEDMNAIQENPECYTLALVVLDINRLKHVNDTYGHRAGDNLITCAANCIRDKFAGAGTCYRIGGDEFVVIIRDFSEQSLKKILTEFQNSVSEADTGKPEELSISAGYAAGVAESGNFAYRLYEQADQSMYAEKEKFRKQHKNFSEIH